MLTSKRFEKVGDPQVLKKGSREERRMKLIEKYRQDIQKRKAKMDQCTVIEPERQEAAKNCGFQEISDSDEDCLYQEPNASKQLSNQVQFQANFLMVID